MSDERAPTAMRWLMMVSSLDASDGGPPPAILSLSIALADRNQSVTILTHRHRGQQAHHLVSTAREHGVAIIWINRRRATRFQFSPRMSLAARRLSRASDIVVGHGFYQWTCVAAFLATTGSRRALLLQPHGVFEPYQEQTSPSVKRMFQAVVGTRILRRTHAIVATSHSEAAGLHATLDSACPPVVVAGLGVGVNPTVERDFTQRRVLFLSRIAPKKRLDKLIDAAGILLDRGAPVELTVCGNGEPDLIADLMARTATGVNIRWAGHVSGAARSAIEATESVFCLPSDNENFGQAVIEAMAVGLPVVTTRATGSAEHVERAGAGWILKDPTPAELADALHEAFDNPGRLVEMARLGRAYAVANLGWETIADRWVDCASPLGNGRPLDVEPTA